MAVPSISQEASSSVFESDVKKLTLDEVIMHIHSLHRLTLFPHPIFPPFFKTLYLLLPFLRHILIFLPRLISPLYTASQVVDQEAFPTGWGNEWATLRAISRSMNEFWGRVSFYVDFWLTFFTNACRNFKCYAEMIPLTSMVCWINLGTVWIKRRLQLINSQRLSRKYCSQPRVVH